MKRAASGRAPRPTSVELTLDPRIPLSGDLGAGEYGRVSASFQERLHLIYGFCVGVCRQTSLDGVMREVVDALGRLVRADRVLVAALDERGWPTASAAKGIAPAGALADWPVNQELVRTALDRGLAVLGVDASATPPRTALCVPVGGGPERLGLLYADNPLAEGRFTELDLRFFTALGHLIFLAVRNAAVLENALAGQARAVEQLAGLERELLKDHRIVGRAPALLKAFGELKRAAVRELPILIRGETGTGKELFARAAHQTSPRAAGPFVAVNLAEVNANLIESELFGHEKGAFTGAQARRLGRFELADRGTLFLDEVAEIPPHVQAKLLRVLETGEFERVGGSARLRSDFRVVAATHRDLEAMVAAGDFREDLFYRLVGVTVSIPALRERIADIPELAAHAFARLKSAKCFSPSALRALQAYPWPGNVRQFVRVVETVDALCPRDVVEPADLPPPLHAPAAARRDFPKLAEVVREVERAHFRRALDATGGNKEKACALLGLSRDTFWRRLKEFAEEE